MKNYPVRWPGTIANIPIANIPIANIPSIKYPSIRYPSITYSSINYRLGGPGHHETISRIIG